MSVTITGTITDFEVDVTRDSVTDVTALAVCSCAAVAASPAAPVFQGGITRSPHKYRGECFKGVQGESLPQGYF
ncbi:MAG: hypothetical protein IK990_14200 [Ruminiclostridium sp.]|nr:hypothetical protein [Ruminiclostridium sp.]